MWKSLNLQVECGATLSRAHWHDIQKWSSELDLVELEGGLKDDLFECPQEAYQNFMDGTAPSHAREKTQPRADQVERHHSCKIYDADMQNDAAIFGVGGILARTWDRDAVRESLRQRFLSRHLLFQLKGGLTSAMWGVKVFQAQMSDAREVWRRGIATIRNVMNDEVPYDLRDVFSCIQVSLAVRLTLGQYGKMDQVPSNNILAADLKRWGARFSASDWSLFHDLSELIWGQNRYDDRQVNNWDLCHEDALQDFQHLFETLLAGCREIGIVGEPLTPHVVRDFQQFKPAIKSPHQSQ